MSDPVKRVVVVRKKTQVLPVWESDKIMGKERTLGRKARKARNKPLREDGRDFFTFCWPMDQFDEFAKKCIASGEKPNECVWKMIQKYMGAEE